MAAMTWLQSLDVWLFRFINQTLSHPLLDAVMPFFSGNRLFFPALAVIAALLVWKGGARGRLCLVMLLVIIPLGDSLVISMLKQAVGRPRPFLALEDVHLLVGRGGSGSMPSSHAANWFAAVLTLYVYYRRSWRFMVPCGSFVALSRIYVGVHYPSDVLAGAILGAGYAAGGLWLIQTLWCRLAPEWFPRWAKALPSLLNPRPPRRPASEPNTPAACRDQR